MTDLADYTSSGDVNLINFDEDYRAAKSVAGKHLESANVAALTARAKQLADAQHLLLPDADVLLERCIVAILSGHVVLQGPPGTGKTTLAYVLAEVFNASCHLETATADWSTYDVIGGLHPTATKNIDTLEPWLGHVPRAAVRCANVIAEHDDPDTDQPRQAHWLIIDEFSRAEIDKAIGPLYTVLGGDGDEAPLPLWFGAAPETREVWLPHRFRIVGTMNTVDTNYVNTFSQGLSRRFQFVYVGVPEKSQVGDELLQARTSAAEWYATTYGSTDFAPADFVADGRIAHVSAIIQEMLEAIRYDDSAAERQGWPLGTAQMVDVYRQLALRLPSVGGDTAALVPALDFALADRVIPQAGNLGRSQLETMEKWLAAQDLPGTLQALRHLRSASATGY